MTEDSTAVQAGQIWVHREDGYEVTTTRVTADHVHYDVDDAEAREQKAAVDAFLADEFGYSLVYVAKLGGGCLKPATFETTFEYDRERERHDYES